MRFPKKILFSLVSFISNLKDEYRADYYKYFYKYRANIADDLRLGKYSSIMIAPGALNALLVIKQRNVFRQFCIITLDAAGILTLGENNFFNNNCSLNCLGKITIGCDNLFGENIKIYDHNHVFNKKGKSVRDQGFKIGQIVIGNNCWIGSNCVILNNVTIGDNVVIGANNLIIKSIPSNTLVKSVPYSVNNIINFI